MLATHKVSVRRGQPGNHRQQGVVERFNRTLSEALFSNQYAKEMLLVERGSSERSSEWVSRLPAVIKAINNTPTHLTGKKPVDAIKGKLVTAKASLPSITPERPILPPNVLVRYLYTPGELEGGGKRATDPVWSMSTHSIRNVVSKTADSPNMYYLEGGPRKNFVREELQVVPADTELTPNKVK